jgi:hypothetical protein
VNERNAVKYVDRECLQCERLLLKARALLSRCAFARWQIDRIAECDRQLEALDQARSDYERLKMQYMQGRDHHRALRLRLRRQYYAELRAHDEKPNDALGIEAKVEEYLRVVERTPQPVQAVAEAHPLNATLAAVHEAQIEASSCASDYCGAHNTLYRVIDESRDQAIALEALAIRMYDQEHPPRRLRDELFEQVRE